MVEQFEEINQIEPNSVIKIESNIGPSISYTVYVKTTENKLLKITENDISTRISVEPYLVLIQLKVGHISDLCRKYSTHFTSLTLNF